MAALAVFALAGGLAASGLGENSCEPVQPGSIAESTEFTPFELQRSMLGEVNLPNLPSAQPGIPNETRFAAAPAIDGHVRQLAAANGAGAIYSYYLTEPLKGMTLSDFHLLGGLELHQDPMEADAPFAAYLLSVLGDRVRPVVIGRYDGALTWGDPDSKGTRVHGLYWSDGEYNYSLIADRPADRLVTIGRELVCSFHGTDT